MSLTLVGQEHSRRPTQRALGLPFPLHLDQTPHAEQVLARQPDRLEGDGRADQAGIVVQARQDPGVISELISLSNGHVRQQDIRQAREQDVRQGRVVERPRADAAVGTNLAQCRAGERLEARGCGQSRALVVLLQDPGASALTRTVTLTDRLTFSQR